MVFVFNKTSVVYHDIFNYPLRKDELKTWYTPLRLKNSKLKVTSKNNFFFLKGRSEIIKKRLENERHSNRKLKIAKRAANLISKIPTVLFVGLTGSLAMRNAGKDSDIDLMIITKKNQLWTTRFLVYAALFFSDFKIRRPNEFDEKDRLCINIWLDIENLSWPREDRNVYTAHEILQIDPLVDRYDVVNLFSRENAWALKYWPNAPLLSKVNTSFNDKGPLIISLDEPSIFKKIYDYVEKILFCLQCFYMKNKKTSEVVLTGRAIFHPKDWSKVVFKKLSKIKF